MGVEISAVYSGKLRCDASHGPSGMTLHTDAPVDNGGQGKSFSPTDLVATALGTCVMTILGLVADRHQVDIEGTRVSVIKEMIAKPVRRIGGLKTHVIFPTSLQVDDSMKKRLEEAARKCPVHQSLHPDIDAPITFEYGDGS